MSKFNTDYGKIIDLPDPRTREQILGQLSGPGGMLTVLYSKHRN